MDHYGIASEMMLRAPVRDFIDIVYLASTVHRPDIEHVVPRGWHHTDFLNDENADAIPHLGQVVLLLTRPEKLISKTLNAHATCVVYCASLHLLGGYVLRLGIEGGYYHQRGL